jgi:hypothetical protein
VDERVHRKPGGEQSGEEKQGLKDQIQAAAGIDRFDAGKGFCELGEHRQRKSEIHKDQ